MKGEFQFTYNSPGVVRSAFIKARVLFFPTRYFFQCRVLFGAGFFFGKKIQTLRLE